MAAALKFPIELKLTVGQREFLLDRLDAGGALAECMIDTFEDEPAMHLSFSEWESKAEVLAACMRHVNHLGGCTILIDDKFEIELLVDALVGSTLLARLREGQHESPAAARDYAGGKRIAAKLQQIFTKLFGREVECPPVE